jgi:hypothetical protein
VNGTRVTVRLACVYAAFLGCAPVSGAEAFITDQTGDEVSADGNSVYVVNWFSNEVWAIKYRDAGGDRENARRRRPPRVRNVFARNAVNSSYRVTSIVVRVALGVPFGVVGDVTEFEWELVPARAKTAVHRSPAAQAIERHDAGEPMREIA